MPAPKPPLSRLSLCLSVLMLVSIACTLPFSPSTLLATLQPTAIQNAGATPTNPPATKTTPKAPLTATSTLAVTPKATTVAAPPEPPAEAMDIYQQNLKSKIWTEGQGLLLLMQYATGKKTAQEVFGDQKIEPFELNGLNAQVNTFLQKNKDAKEAAELKQMQAALRPSIEAIMKYAAPEGSAAAMRQIVPAAFHLSPLKLDEPCADLWEYGFPAPQPGQPPLICVLYKTFQVQGKTFRIFYPKNFAGTAVTPANLGWAQTAMTDSGNTYAGISGNKLPDTDMVYVSLPSNVGAWAQAGYANGSCSLFAFPKMISNDEKYFKMTVAHELFHCYQSVYLHGDFDNAASYEMKKWWAEGSAEYFSNVVYPTYNDEWERIPEFDFYSQTKSLFELTYANTFFFQYMGNRLGNPGVLGVLNGLPDDGGESATATALEELIPDFPHFFDDYARAYMDGNIEDTGGGLIPFSQEPGQDINFSGDGSQPLKTLALVITRYRFIYEKGTYTQTETTDGKGMDEVKAFNTAGSWEKLPGEVKANCDTRALIYLMTSTNTNYPYKTTIKYSSQNPTDDTECDKCLIGYWKLNSDSFNSYMDAVVKPPAQHNQAFADLIAHFDEGGVLSVLYNKVTESFTISQTDVNNSPLNINMEVLMTGTSSADYTTKDGYINLANGNPQIQTTFKMNGIDMGGNLIDPGMMGNWYGFAPVDKYTCTDKMLTMNPQIPGTPVPALLFTKIKPPAGP